MSDKLVWMVLVCLVGCTDLVDDDDDDDAAGPTWSYDGATGPEFWGDLSDEWATCGDGDEQSPIDLTGEIGIPRPSGLSFTYGSTPLSIFDDGHTIEVTVPAGNTMDFEGTVYTLERFHFHAESGHTWDGQHAPIEVHFVHRDGENYAVAAGFLVPQQDDGPPNTAFDPVFENLPSEVTESAVLVDGVSVDLAALLPSDRGYFSYLGSLTMPPCTEGVQWLLLAEPMEIPSEQIEDFRAIYDHNYRPTQPVNGREIQAGESD